MMYPKNIATMSRDEHNNDWHRFTGTFDFYCVAHGEDYSPKYMDGVICHNGMGEGYCADECRRCPQRCPVDGCNEEEFYD